MGGFLKGAVAGLLDPGGFTGVGAKLAAKDAKNSLATVKPVAAVSTTPSIPAWVTPAGIGLIILIGGVFVWKRLSKK
jgi:hypothetical protein